MQKSDYKTSNRDFESGDIIGDIITRYIGVKSENTCTPRLNHLDKKPKSPLDKVPHNSVTDFERDMATKITKFGEGPTDVLSKSAAIQCINCGNMAKNLAYLENYIKTNAPKKSSCTTCTTSLSFLEYLNKNIETVFNNINSAGLFVLEQKAVAQAKQINQANSPSVTKTHVKGLKKEKRVCKTTTGPPKAKAMLSQMTTVSSSAKSVGKGRLKKKTSSKVKKNLSQNDENKVVKAKVKKARKAPKSPSKLATRSEITGQK